MFAPISLTPLFASGAVTVDLNMTAIAHLVLFTAFVVLMKDLIFDPLLKVFEEREKRTSGAIDKARKMDEQALSLKQEYDTKLEDVRREAAVDREHVRAKVKKLETEMTTSARDAVSKTLETGMSKIDAEVSGIRQDLDAQRGPLASQIASRVLGRHVEGRHVEGRVRS